jgi:hypothetical protein
VNGLKIGEIAKLARVGVEATVVALVLLVVGAILAPRAEAQIVAPAGRTLFNDRVLLRTLVRFDAFEEPPGEGDLRRFRNVYALVWGARPHLSLSLVTPLVRTERAAPAGGGPAVASSGIGDTSVFARYDVLRRTRPGGYTRLAPELGVKLPTGGAFGSGSTDLVAGLVFSHVGDPHWWIADLQWTAPGTGDASVRAGVRRRFDLAYLRRVLPRGRLGVPMGLLVLELNGESVAGAVRDGTSIPDTGGETLFLSPGFEYVVHRRLILEASVPVAIYADFEGRQPEPAVSLILGARWLF